MLVRTGRHIQIGSPTSCDEANLIFHIAPSKDSIRIKAPFQDAGRPFHVAHIEHHNGYCVRYYFLTIFSNAHQTADPFWLALFLSPLRFHNLDCG